MMVARLSTDHASITHDKSLIGNETPPANFHAFFHATFAGRCAGLRLMALIEEKIMSPFRTITPNFSASPQISVADVAQALRDGFTAVICNRPDNEDMGQVSAQEIAKACADNGLSFTHIPVSGGIPEEAVPLMRDALAASTGPVLAYCRSGTRSTNLWALAEASAGGSPEELVESGARGGYDLRGLMPLLRSLSQAH
jgi:uncharacterized protein (TIGR01244 family)